MPPKADNDCYAGPVRPFAHRQMTMQTDLKVAPQPLFSASLVPAVSGRRTLTPGGRNTRGRHRSDAVPREAETFRPFSPPRRRARPTGPERIPFPVQRRRVPATVAPGDGCGNAISRFQSGERPLRVGLDGRRVSPRFRHMAGHEVAPSAVCERLRLGDPAPDLRAHPAFGALLDLDPFLAPDTLGHPARLLRRPEPVHHRDQRAILTSPKGRVGGGGGRPETSHRSRIRPTGASSGRSSPSLRAMAQAR